MTDKQHDKDEQFENQRDKAEKAEKLRIEELKQKVDEKADPKTPTKETEYPRWVYPTDGGRGKVIMLPEDRPSGWLDAPTLPGGMEGGRVIGTPSTVPCLDPTGDPHFGMDKVAGIDLATGRDPWTGQLSDAKSGKPSDPEAAGKAKEQMLGHYEEDPRVNPEDRDDASRKSGLLGKKK